MEEEKQFKVPKEGEEEVTTDDWFISEGFNSDSWFLVEKENLEKFLKDTKKEDTQVLIEYPEDTKRILKEFDNLEADNILLKDVIRALLKDNDS